MKIRSPMYCKAAIQPLPYADQEDFGYKGQFYFRSTKYSVVRSSSTPVVRFPWAMEEMVKKRIIRPEQVVRFMEMLESENKELERLACITLGELHKKLLK